MKDLVISVKEKIKKLLFVLDELKKENSILRKDIQEHKKQNEIMITKINNLTQKSDLLKINQSIETVRQECTELAIDNAIISYILNDEISDENIIKIKNCLKSKLVDILILDESAIQTNFTVTVQAYISEESISNCL